MAVDKKLENLKKSILATLGDMEKVRRPTKDLRWEACAYVKHRTVAFNLAPTPIKPIKLHSTTQVIIGTRKNFHVYLKNR